MPGKEETTAHFRTGTGGGEHTPQSAKARPLPEGSAARPQQTSFLKQWGWNRGLEASLQVPEPGCPQDARKEAAKGPASPQHRRPQSTSPNGHRQGRLTRPQRSFDNSFEDVQNSRAVGEMFKTHLDSYFAKQKATASLTYPGLQGCFATYRSNAVTGKS